MNFELSKSSWIFSKWIFTSLSFCRINLQINSNMFLSFNYNRFSSSTTQPSLKLKQNISTLKCYHTSKTPCCGSNPSQLLRYSHSQPCSTHVPVYQISLWLMNFSLHKAKKSAWLRRQFLINSDFFLASFFWSFGEVRFIVICIRDKHTR